MLSPFEASNKYPNIFKVSPTGGYEMFCDNHILAQMRMCEAMFVESILNKVSPISQGVSWSLQFGQWVHKCFEIYYSWRCENKEFAINEWLVSSAQAWSDMNMEQFIDRKQYKSLGGKEGALAILVDYYDTHYGWKERLKIVGCELPFGYSKEVPLGTFSVPEDTVNCYLAGRIDMLVDDGVFIGPLDHKTTAYFDGSEGEGFKPHDGMTGYVYATDKMLGAQFAEQGRQCRQMIVNHISLKVPKDKEDRFKRSFLQYTLGQFEEYRIRQLATFKRIFELAVLGEQPHWNTFLCANIYHNDCQFKRLHEAPPEVRPDKLRAFYKIGEAWDWNRND